jgi:hypothetical protein
MESSINEAVEQITALFDGLTGIIALGFDDKLTLAEKEVLTLDLYKIGYRDLAEDLRQKWEIGEYADVDSNG